MRCLTNIRGEDSNAYHNHGPSMLYLGLGDWNSQRPDQFAGRVALHWACFRNQPRTCHQPFTNGQDTIGDEGPTGQSGPVRRSWWEANP